MKRFLGLCITCVLLLSACGNIKNVEESNELAVKDSVIIAMSPESEPASGFDPAYGWGAGEHVHEPLIQSTLTVSNADLSIGYDLATDMSVSPDGLAWTVNILDDAYFTNGEKLLASDVAFTYNTVKKTSTVSDFTMLDYAEASGDSTVVFHMKKPYSIWPYTMAITGIVPESVYDSNYGQKPIGSGRYILKQWDKGQQVILEANSNYYGKPILMKKVVLLFMDEAAAFAAIKAGQVDLAYTAASYADQELENYQLLSFETVDNRGFNLPAIPEKIENGLLIGNNFTSDISVRRAINIGLDREKIIDNVLNGYGSPAYSVCDKMPWYNPKTQLEYNFNEAETLLENSGWKKDTDGIRKKGNVPAAMELMYPAGDSVRQALAAETAIQLNSLGIDVKAKEVSWDTAYDNAQSKPLIWGWGAHTPMELYHIYHSTKETGLARYSPYSNSTVDNLMDEALASNNLEESYKLWQNAQYNGETGVSQQGDVPWIWLVNIDHLYWSDKSLQVAEQKLHPHGHGWSIVNNVDQWSFGVKCGAQ